MSLQDSLFSDDVENDLIIFSKDDSRKRVLVFPPVNNYRRFLIHQLVQERFANLLYTFSIGQGDARRTVVCYKTDVIRDPKLNVSTFKTSGDTKSDTMGVQEQCSLSSTPEISVQKQRQVKTVPTVEIYRPPAARRKRNEPVPSESMTNHPVPDSCASTKTVRQKRPDRAVYVPRPRRSLEVEGSPVRQEKPRLDKQRESNSMNSVKLTQSSSAIINERLNLEVEPKFIETQQKNSTDNSKRDQSSDFQSNHSSNSSNYSYSSTIEDPSRTENLTLEMNENLRKSELETNCVTDTKVEENDDKICENKNELLSIDEREMSEAVNEGNSVFESNKKDCDIKMTLKQNRQETENDAARRDIVANQKNNRIVSNSSNALIISKQRSRVDVVKEESVVTPMTPPEKKVKKIERQKSKPAAPPSPPIKINRDDSDWDSLFDDNGDCLDPTLINELSSAVGEVTIEQPKNNYKAYTKNIEVSSDEFAHVLEIYNFPAEFKTCDLVAVFNPFKNGGFELKWVDDTHCLGVFSSPLVAAEVLASDHPFVKTRPLSEATALSKTKARKSSEFLQPYRNRPETCAALARRLVTGALGVRLATARQEREHEKNVLREAKEKKKLANKQRDDAWEGLIGEK